MRKRMHFIILLLSVALIWTGCYSGLEPTDPVYTDEEIWERCVEVVEDYFHSDSMHILVDTVVVLRESELHVASEQWYSGDACYAENVQNEDYRFSRLQVNGRFYTQYSDGVWVFAEADSTEFNTYQHMKLDETDGSGVSWEISENEICVTHQVSDAGSDAEETAGSRITTYVFDSEWRLVQINIISMEEPADTEGGAVIEEVRQTIICYDTDEAVIKQRIEDAYAQVSAEN